MTFISCRRRLTKVLAGATRGEKKEVRLGRPSDVIGCWYHFQECWSIRIIHHLLDTTLNHVHRQFEMAYQLVLQSHQSPGSNIRYHHLASSASTSLLTPWWVYIYSWWKPVLAENPLYFIFSGLLLCSSDFYRCQSGRRCTLPFFLTIFIISPSQVFHLY